MTPRETIHPIRFCCRDLLGDSQNLERSLLSSFPLRDLFSTCHSLVVSPFNRNEEAEERGEKDSG